MTNPAWTEKRGMLLLKRGGTDLARLDDALYGRPGTRLPKTVTKVVRVVWPLCGDVLDKYSHKLLMTLRYHRRTQHKSRLCARAAAAEGEGREARQGGEAPPSLPGSGAAEGGGTTGPRRRRRRRGGLTSPYSGWWKRRRRRSRRQQRAFHPRGPAIDPSLARRKKGRLRRDPQGH